uniref:fibril-forming collagen alpha chain-like n=1 Tax=Callithrix jacchus TaxID=9483 RepID=UPI0023DD5B0F|nr:fibril-forming collagen alpha chain-like [Callithrix jacchus]
MEFELANPHRSRNGEAYQRGVPGPAGRTPGQGLRVCGTWTLLPRRVGPGGHARGPGDRGAAGVARGGARRPGARTAALRGAQLVLRGRSGPKAACPHQPSPASAAPLPRARGSRPHLAAGSGPAALGLPGPTAEVYDLGRGGCDACIRPLLLKSRLRAEQTVAFITCKITKFGCQLLGNAFSASVDASIVSLPLPLLTLAAVKIWSRNPTPPGLSRMLNARTQH